MSKPGLFLLFLPVAAFFIVLSSCKTGAGKISNESGYLVELKSGLDGSYITEHYGRQEGIQLQVNERPASRAKNQWICIVHYKNPTQLNNWIAQLNLDQNILRIIPAINHPDPPVNDTIKPAQKITPKF